MLLKQKQNKTVNPLFYKAILKGSLGVLLCVPACSRIVCDKNHFTFWFVSRFTMGSAASGLWVGHAVSLTACSPCAQAEPLKKEFLTAWSLLVIHGKWHLELVCVKDMTSPLIIQRCPSNWHPHAGCDSSLGLTTYRKFSNNSTFLSCPFFLLFLLSPSQKVPKLPYKEEFCGERWAVVQAPTIWIIGVDGDCSLLSADDRICAPAAVLILLTISVGWWGPVSNLFCFSSAKIQSSWWEETLLG